MNHGKLKSLGDKWSNMERRLKDEQATMTKLKDQLKQHEESVKERKTKMATVESELDEAAQDLNDAHGAAAMAAPVPRPSPTPSQDLAPAERQKATGDASTRRRRATRRHRLDRKAFSAHPRAHPEAAPRSDARAARKLRCPTLPGVDALWKISMRQKMKRIARMMLRSARLNVESPEAGHLEWRV